MTNQLPERILRLIEKEQDQTEKLEIAKSEYLRQKDAVDALIRQIDEITLSYFGTEKGNRHILQEGTYKGEIATIVGIKHNLNEWSPLDIRYFIEAEKSLIEASAEIVGFFSRSTFYDSPECPICGEKLVYEEAFSAEYGYVNGFRVECAGCEISADTLTELNKIADNAMGIVTDEVEKPRS